MLLAAERRLVARFARRLVPDGLAVGTGGNLSARLGDLLAVTPRGLAYEDLVPELVCVVDLKGVVVEGELAPSTELPMHLAAYDTTDALAVVHAHSPFATSLSAVAAELPAVHYLVAEFGGPVPVAPYATPGTEALARVMAEGFRERRAVILQNHGTIVVGDSLERAYDRAILLEWLCALYARARMLGDPRVLDRMEIAQVANLLGKYRQSPP
ncbi:MAG TPA: class II aldolase/adducin family protein [Actinomycetota bacterium]|nr:class II aldolase/adducin family protein [Actinomycetota bacterium]